MIGIAFPHVEHFIELMTLSPLLELAMVKRLMARSDPYPDGKIMSNRLSATDDFSLAYVGTAGAKMRRPKRLSLGILVIDMNVSGRCDEGWSGDFYWSTAE
jgi:hypothetical protein